jgi:hypothetical protein
MGRGSGKQESKEDYIMTLVQESAQTKKKERKSE